MTQAEVTWPPERELGLLLVGIGTIQAGQSHQISVVKSWVEKHPTQVLESLS